MSSSYEMPALGYVTPQPQAEPTQVQPETRLSAENNRARSSGRDNPIRTLKAQPKQLDFTSRDLEDVAQELQLYVERSSPPSVARTEDRANSVAVEDVHEASKDSKHSGPGLFSRIRKKCFSPLGLALLALVTTTLYFVLQYDLSVEANRLTLRESCRSHPNDSYLQTLAICQDARLEGDVDSNLRSPVVSKKLLASLPNITFEPLLIDSNKYISALLAWAKYVYAGLDSWIVIFFERTFRILSIQNCKIYLGLITLIWISWPVTSFCLSWLMVSLWWSLTIFLEIQIEESPRGTHFWVRRKAPSAQALYRNLSEGLRMFNSLYLIWGYKKNLEQKGIHGAGIHERR